MNDRIAIGFRGDTGYNAQIIGHVFGVYEQAMDEGWQHPIEEVEKRGISRPDLGLDDVANIVSKCCAAILWRMERALKAGERVTEYKGNVLVLSTAPGGVAAYGWRTEKNCSQEGIMMARPQVIAPGTDKVRNRVRRVLACRSRGPETRASKAMRIIAAQSDTVNENVTLRRSSSGFTLERLY